MTREEAEIYAKTMTYENALHNLSRARAIPYRKATFIKVNELIKALSQEPCDDAVSRARIIDELNRLGRNAFKDDTDYDNFFAFVDSLSSVNPQPCDDAISREAVIEATYHCGDLQEVRGVVQQLPSVNPQPSEHFIDGVHAIGYREGYKDAQKQKSGKWISVREKLPEEGEDVLACFYTGEGNYKMMVSRRSDYNYWSGVGRADIVAWMPLPEQYEPQEREE